MKAYDSFVAAGDKDKWVEEEGRRRVEGVNEGVEGVEEEGGVESGGG